MIIYKVTNLINNKTYIGQTIQDLKIRWKSHQHKGHALYNSIKKYGKENFSVEVIDKADTLEELNKKEVQWIEQLNCRTPNGYNIRPGGGSGGIDNPMFGKSGMSGRKHTLDSKKKMSESQTRIGRSEEFREALRKRNRMVKLTKDKIDRQKAAIAHGGKPFICIETGEVFYNLAIAAEKLDLCKSNIYMVLRKKNKQASGFTFKYLEQKEQKHE